MNLSNSIRDNTSIRTKLTFVSLATTAAALLITSLLLIGNEYLSYRNTIVENLMVQAKIIAETSTAAVVFSDKKAADETLAALNASPNIMGATLFVAKKNALASYNRKDVDIEELTLALSEKPVTPQIKLRTITLSEPIVFRGEEIGTIVIQAGLSKLYISIAWFGFITLLVLIAVFGVSFLLLRKLNSSIMNPLSELTNVMHQISNDKHYEARAIPRSHDEIGKMAEVFNDMLDQIQKRDEALEQELIERKNAEERLDRLAHFDTVTLLPNRHYFNERLNAAIAKSITNGTLVALIFLDLDNFKIINDTLGHHVGDMLLKNVAERLSHALHTGDTISRVGGDEFAVIIENFSNQADVISVAKKCIEALSVAASIDGHEIYISASLGISICPDDTDEFHEMLKNADTAMYYAKNRGKNTYQVFMPEMMGKAQERLSMETSLRRAVERNEFLLHYQPQTNMKTGNIIGMEALVRWLHPNLGLVSPIDFIPIAEETGLIVPIGEWVLRTACLQAKAWKDSGLGDLRIAVNLSGRQFKEDNLVETILSIVSETGILPDQLELELTESMLMGVDESILTKLKQLEATGIHLSIDDFGTGYSSMSYLKRFPIHNLKVDKSFIDDLPNDNDDAAITTAIIAMAHSLKMSVTAEGVETKEQLEFLQALDCDISQGYYFSKPLSTDKFEELLKQKKLTHVVESIS